MSKQPSKISGSKTNIILHVYFNKDIPSNIICYNCLVFGTTFFYVLINNTIKENILRCLIVNIIFKKYKHSKVFTTNKLF